LKQQRALVMNIAITILCGFGFMAIKYVEYSHKIHDGLLPGSFYQPAKKAWELPLYQEKFGVSPQAAAVGGGAAAVVGGAAAETVSGQGIGTPVAGQEAAGPAKKLMGPHEFNVEPRNVHRFFSIYFC